VIEASAPRFEGVNLHVLRSVAVNRGPRDSADAAQAAQLAQELDDEIGSLQIILAVQSQSKPMSTRMRHMIKVGRHELAALLLLRHRLKDRYGV
jgi:hypothetical protein